MTGRLVAVGPSLVDISLTLPDLDFARFCEACGARAGEWREILLPASFAALLQALGLREFEALLRAPREDVTMIAGASTLSMLAALEPAARRSSIYASVLGAQNGAATPVADFFAREVRMMGLQHFCPLVEGPNPIGLVVAAAGDPEKILLFHPGVSRSSLGIDFDALEPDLLIIDAYELQHGDLAELLHAVIASRRFRIALSLGNHFILTGRTLDRILAHIRANHFFAIAGNLSEYRALMPEASEDCRTHQGFRHHPIREFVPFSLLTMGEAGMVANWREVCAAEPAVPVAPERIVNTSGAGDAAAGNFFAGALEGRPVGDTLARAALVASRVLQVPGSLVLG